jgi:hypothetical protein
VRMPRAFSASAIARVVVTPAACSSRTTGTTFAANASAPRRSNGASLPASRQRAAERWKSRSTRRSIASAIVSRMFGRLKDWRHVATRYDRSAYTFFSAICIAAAVTFWLT